MNILNAWLAAVLAAAMVGGGMRNAAQAGSGPAQRAEIHEGVHPQPAETRPPLAVKDLHPVLEQEFASIMGAWPQGGLVLGVRDHGQQAVMAFGAAKPDSIFEIGSVTKTFTALALAQMVAQKMVRLDEPVRELLPAGSVSKPAGAEITLLDLATQHSGLPRLPENLRPANRADPYADYTATRLQAYLAQHGVVRPEKTGFLYSNLGVGLLGYGLARRAGVSYGALIRNEVTGPMGMPDTVVALSPRQQKRFVQGYSAAHAAVPPWHLDALAGAGALHSTASDLLRYCAVLMHPETLAEGGNGASLPRAIALLLEPRADVDAEGNVKIALAWMVRTETDLYWHDGGTGGFTALVSFNPRLDRAIVVLYNCEDNLPGKVPLAERAAEHVSALLDGRPALVLGE